jgi:iron complex transport system substrate-binding protein
MRIVSLLPSATEILFALGLGDQVVGVSHECDYPPEARARRRVIHSRLPHNLAPGEIDRLVTEYLARGERLYSTDGEALAELQPDLIVTQDLCHVCAASPDDLASSLSGIPGTPRVLSLNPHSLEDVWEDILLVGEATGREEVARKLVAELRGSTARVSDFMGQVASRSRVVCLEWLDPFFVAGHWVPEMVAHAGGEDVLGRAGFPSFRVTAKQVVAAAPEILLVMPCGYTASEAAREYRAMRLPPGWETIPAVCSGRVFALAASGYFSRPGPRLATGLEILAKLFHPPFQARPEIGELFLQVGGARDRSMVAAQ